MGWCSRWSTYEVKKNDEDKQNVINNVTYYSSYLTNMNAFTRYALYVQTYTTKAIGTNGARSEIIYFKTKASSKFILVFYWKNDPHNMY